MPAGFLLDETGAIRAVHCGAHADDQWPVDKLLGLATPSRRV